MTRVEGLWWKVQLALVAAYALVCGLAAVGWAVGAAVNSGGDGWAPLGWAFVGAAAGAVVGLVAGAIVLHRTGLRPTFAPVAGLVMVAGYLLGTVDLKYLVLCFLAAPVVGVLASLPVRTPARIAWAGLGIGGLAAVVAVGLLGDERSREASIVADLEQAPMVLYAPASRPDVRVTDPLYEPHRRTVAYTVWTGGRSFGIALEATSARPDGCSAYPRQLEAGLWVSDLAWAAACREAEGTRISVDDQTAPAGSDTSLVAQLARDMQPIDARWIADHTGR